MVSQPLDQILPSTEELPCSDDTPVDNEDQNFLPNLLLFMLVNLWADRMDWYFGADMAIYHTTGGNPRKPVVPDGFLSLGVERKKGGKSRRSYATWEENNVVPRMVLEMVSHTPGNEYGEKLNIYAKLGVLYYVIYNPEFWKRDLHQPFEVYKLDQGQYRLQVSEPYWMPEIGLGIGRQTQVLGGIEQELLLWHNVQGQPYPTSDEMLRQMEAALRAERQRAERMAEYLRSLGLDPDNLPDCP